MADTVINLSEHRARRSQPPPETLPGLTPEYATELLAKSVISFTDIETLKLRSDFEPAHFTSLPVYLSALAAGLAEEASQSKHFTREQCDMYDCLPQLEALNFSLVLEKLAERVEQTLAVGV